MSELSENFTDNFDSLAKMPSKKTHVVTFGCRLNTYESSVMEDLAQKACLDQAIIVNTCAVTEEAERQARQMIRRLRRENPDTVIIVTGCSAQINPKMYDDMKEVNFVIGNQEKMNLSAYETIRKDFYRLSAPEQRSESDTHDDKKKVYVEDIFSKKETEHPYLDLDTNFIKGKERAFAHGFDGKARAFVQVQNGCDHRCTFCTIPYGRGNSKSLAIGDIFREIKQLLGNGYQEIVLTGVDITDYGKDLPGQPTLGQMIKRILALLPNLIRLRLSSLDPIEVDSDLWALIETEPRLLPHFHLSLQSGNNLILKRMKRRHLRHHIIEFCERVYASREASIGADIIAGFPTETEECFKDTFDIIEECRLVFLHVFPFSKRNNTPASRMPQVPKHIIKERAKQLRDKGSEVYRHYLKTWENKQVNVLIESKTTFDGSVILKGKTDHFLPIEIPLMAIDNIDKNNRVICCQVVSSSNEMLFGKIINRSHS